MAEDDAFDEEYYLAKYPDVAAAVAARGWPSGQAHYEAVGRARGRHPSATAEQAARAPAPPPTPPAPIPTRPTAPPPPGFDAGFYLAAYPQAEADIAAHQAEDAHSHYIRLGRHRGYLPNRRAPRPTNPAAPNSRFGGFWTDHANALDLLAGRADLGHLTAPQAAQLRAYIEDGYLILPNPFPTTLLDRAATDLDRAFAGTIPEARFQPESHLLDPHWLSPAIRDLAFHDTILAILHVILERRALLTRSIAAKIGRASCRERV